LNRVHYGTYWEVLMAAGDTSSPITMVLVLDDPVEVLYARDSLELHKVLNPLHVVRHVREAMAFLCREPPFQAAPRPDVLLLDLNLPGADGRRLLEFLATGPDLARVPVFVLVDSPETERILRAEGLAVRGYVSKPIDFATVRTLVKAVETFGFAVLREP
jgi:CheY-like chemotaxis protein